MIINRTAASFGKLENSVLTFKPGLNIISAPNEWGKSTWCAFVDNMLYGINTADRDKTGYLSDKTKYRPWNGREMEGTMDITVSGDNITLQRTALGKAPMRNFTAVYTGTEIPVKGLTSENAGASLTGVTRPVFQRTAFIRQHGLHVTQTPDLEKKISSIISSGDETLSFTDVYGKLKNQLNKLKHNNTGAIPAEAEKLAEARAALDSIHGASRDAAGLRRETENLIKLNEDLEKELEAIRIMDMINERDKLKNSELEAQRARAEADRAKAELEAYPSTAPELLDEIRGGLSELSMAEELRAEAETAVQTAQEDFDKAKLGTEGSVFSGKPPEKAAESIAAVKKAEDTVAEKKKTASIVTPLFILAGICAAAAGFILSFNTTALLCFCGAGLILICAGFLFRLPIKKAKDVLNAVMAQYNNYSSDILRVKCQSYTEAYEKSEAAGIALENARAALLKAENTEGEKRSMVIQKARTVDPAVSGPEDILPSLEKIRAAKSLAAELSAKAKSAESYYEAVKASTSPKEEAADITPPDIIPRRTKSETLGLLKDARRRLDTAKDNYNLTQGRMRALGDPIVIEGEINRRTENLKQLQSRYDAVNLAMETLSEADREIHTRFAPVLAKTAGQIFAKLTGGIYDMVAFDRTLDAAAQAKGDTVSRNVLTLSAGTEDQLYLALRLAICSLAMDEHNPCPIIMDDALASFDDGRARMALDFLRELAKTRQIILLSCHTREAEYMKDCEDVNIITL